MDRNCRGCRYWAVREEEWREREWLADCRRRGPQWDETPAHEGYSGRERKWPVTRPEDWCGDFEPLKPQRVEFVGTFPRFGWDWLRRNKTPR